MLKIVQTWELYERRLSKQGYEELKKLYAHVIATKNEVDPPVTILPYPYPEPEVEPVEPEDGIWNYWYLVKDHAPGFFKNEKDYETVK